MQQSAADKLSISCRSLPLIHRKRSPFPPQGEGFFHFAENLYRLPNQKGLTQQELADALNIKRSNIGMYEKGTNLPHHAKLKIFADFFGVDMNTLLADGDGAALTPAELRHLDQYRQLDTENQSAINKQIDYLLYEQEQEYKKDGATSAS